MVEKILSCYGIGDNAVSQQHGSGLINNTWKIHNQSGNYILQRINEKVFENPSHISSNIDLIASWLEKNHPEYFFVAPIKTKNGESILHVPANGYYRLFHFVEDSVTHDTAQSAQHAFEAARQFGLFTRMLNGFPIENLKTTIPDFHNLIHRHQQFLFAVQHGNPSRIEEARQTIQFLSLHNHIVATYQTIISDQQFKRRVTHHDTKISNVLFDKHGKGICVIDLDTVMPGYFISDVGDMIRTYLSPVSEEEKDFNKIQMREDFFEAIAKGYLSEMGSELSKGEIRHFVYGGMFMIYMQALRFLTDYLNNDIYYGAAYEGHNYLRAKNQVVLLEKLLEKKDKFNKMVTKLGKSTH